MSDMLEAQIFSSLTTFLAYQAETQLGTSPSKAPCNCDITYWLEAIQYIFQTNATATAIREIPEYFRIFKQEPDEREEQYRKHFHKSKFICANVHSKD